MGSGAGMVRARRSRGRPDVTVPRTLVALALAGVALLTLAGFGVGLWVGRGPQPRLAAVAPGAVPVLAAPSASVVPAAVVPPATAAGEGPRAPATVEPSRAPQVPLVTPSAAPAVAGDAASVAPPAVTIRTSAPARGYGLQVGAFESEADARAFVGANAAALAAVPVYVVGTAVDGRTWYRVRLGEVKSRAAAESLRSQLAPALAARAIVVSHR